MKVQIDHRHVVRLLGLGRVAIGVTLLALPSRAGRAWLGGVATQPAARVAIRALGARDLVMGLGTLRALDQGDGSLRQWVTYAGICDLTDAVATTLALPSLPPRTRLASVAMAGGAATASFVARDRLD